MNDIARNQGALLLGGFIAAGLSGIVLVQTLIYFKFYPSDPSITKALVSVIWMLDITHSGLVVASVWNYVVQNFGDADDINNIPETLALTIIITAVLTYLVHCYLAHRIFLLSRRNWFLTVPMLFLATCRLCSASATSAEMIRLRTFSTFKADFRWLFSLGLALSSIVDILITLCLCFLLQKNRTNSLSLDRIIDALILYTFEVGSLTCAGSITSMICWLTMNNNLIFMGLHFVIGKLYANSLLSVLNTRYELRRQRRVPAVNVESPQRRNSFQFYNPSMNSDIHLQHVQINVEKSVTYDHSA